MGCCQGRDENIVFKQPAGGKKPEQNKLLLESENAGKPEENIEIQECSEPAPESENLQKPLRISKPKATSEPPIESSKFSESQRTKETEEIPKSSKHPKQSKEIDDLPELASNPSLSLTRTSTRPDSQGQISTELKKLKEDLEELQQLKQWEKLVSLIKDPTPIQKGGFKFAWTDPPETVGSYVLVFLCKVFQNSREDIVEYLHPASPTLIDCINNGTPDRRDHALMLLYYFLDFAEAEEIDKLVELNIFGILMRTMMCSKKELRHLTAGVCDRLYRNRLSIRRLFISTNGGRYLMQQISWSSDDNEILKVLLDYLIDLLEDEYGNVDQQIVDNLNKDMARDIIRDIITENKDADTIELMDTIITYLSFEENNN